MYPRLIVAAGVILAFGSLTFAADSTPAESAPGDRGLPINQVYPADAFYHNGKGGRVLDVTKPPFNAKGDGVTDDTGALNAAMRFVRDNYQLLQGQGFSYCTQRFNRNWIIYLPNGEYLVTDTVNQGWPALAMNILNGWEDVEYVRVQSPEHERSDTKLVYAENNWAIRLIGQSRDRTIIRLTDSAPGFGKGPDKAVITFHLLERGSNVNAGNMVENITIDTGRGNPGAVGLKWNSSNYGGVRNVAIRSADGAGRAGLLMERRNAMGYLHDVLIEGFDVGIKLAAGHESAIALEYATLAGQRETALSVGGGRAVDSLSARKIATRGAPAALRVGPAGQVVLLDSALMSDAQNNAALTVEPDGHLFARDVRLSGYRAAVAIQDKAVCDGPVIKEYLSAEPVCVDEGTPGRSLRLPVKDSPPMLPEQDLSAWANVDHFGAMGDGVTDDTAAIQRAMNSGKPVVYFPKANYVINTTVDIPATVREITWLLGSVHRSVATERGGPALLRVAEPSKEPLRIHQAYTAGGVFLDHEADRPVVLEDIVVWFHHVRSYARGADMLFPSPAAQDTEIWRLYRNTRPEGATKELFANNCLFFAADDRETRHAVENVRVWARMIDNEHLPGTQYAFRRSDAWILGFKSENADTLFRADDGSRLEILGGAFLNWERRKGPVIISNDSQVSATFFTWNWSATAETMFERKANGVTTTLPATRFSKLDNVDGAFVVFR